MVETILKICVLPILIVLTKFIIDYLAAKRDEIKAETDNEIAQKYIDLIYETVKKCVLATSQTFVDSLKANGEFDEEAQKEAFKRTMDAVLLILSDDAKEYITEMTGDLEVYLTQLIEAQVHLYK